MERHEFLFDPDVQQRLKKEVKGCTFKSIVQGVSLCRTAIKSLRLYEKKGFVGTGLSNVDQDAMFVLHGEHARILGNKSCFPTLVRELGYKAPESFLVKTDKIPPEKRAEEVLSYYQNRERKARGSEVTKLFVKPLNGTWQRDLVGFDTSTDEDREDLKRYLAEVKEYTLVQELIPHEENFRYIRYRTNSNGVYFACFKYARDKAADKKVNMPFIGEKVHAKASGVTNNKYFETLINLTAVPLDNDSHQLDNLNNFIEGFTSVLEVRLGGKLPILSVDIGIVDLQKLGKDYDEETMRNNIVFFETQTLPLSWEFRQHNVPHPFGTYINMWKMFLKEHGEDVLRREKALRAVYKQHAKAK